MEKIGAIDDVDVDDAIRGIDLSHFHQESLMQGKLREMLWTRRDVFK